MSISYVSEEGLGQIRAAFENYSNAANAALSQCDREASALIRNCEMKLSELSRIRDEKYSALLRCGNMQVYNNAISCTAQERAFDIANDRYRRCMELVRHINSAYRQYKSKEGGYSSRQRGLTQNALSSLKELMCTVGKYTEGGDASQGLNSANGGENFVEGNRNWCSWGESNPVSDDGMPTSIHIKGGENIDHIISKGTGRNPVHLDMDAMAHRFDNLPPVTSPDHKTVRAAAAGIVSALAAGGMAVGMRELLVRQKTDELFEKQYGVESTKIFIGPGGNRQKEYVDAYNGIRRDLEVEMREVQKDNLREKIRESEEKYKRISENVEELRKKGQWINLSFNERMNEEQVIIANYKNQLATMDDGVRRPVIQLEKYSVGGLSASSLKLMKDAMSSDQRFATVSNILAPTGATLSGDDGSRYTFSRNENDVYFVSHDGSSVDHYYRDLDASATIGASFSGPFVNNRIVDEFKEEGGKADNQYVNGGGVVGGSIGLSGPLCKTYNVHVEHYSINPDGSAKMWNIDVNAGLEVSGSIGGTVGFNKLKASADVNADILKAEGKAKIISAPFVMNDKIRQIDGGVRLTGKVGVGFGGSLGTDGAHVNLPLVELAADWGTNAVNPEALPAEIIEELKKSLQVKKDAFDSYSDAMNGERPKI